MKLAIGDGLVLIQRQRHSKALFLVCATELDAFTIHTTVSPDINPLRSTSGSSPIWIPSHKLNEAFKLGLRVHHQDDIIKALRLLNNEIRILKIWIRSRKILRKTMRRSSSANNFLLGW